MRTGENGADTVHKRGRTTQLVGARAQQIIAGDFDGRATDVSKMKFNSETLDIKMNGKLKR